jgi:hypothetical protein
MRTIDDRSQPVTLLRLDKHSMRSAEQVPAWMSEVHKQRHRRVVRRNALILWAVMVIALIVMWLGKILFTFAWLIAAFLAAVAMLIVLVFAVRRLDRIDRIHSMPAAGLCPACGYGIRGVRPAEDGCTVCPECGAAWRVPRSAKDSDQSSKSSA